MLTTEYRLLKAKTFCKEFFFTIADNSVCRSRRTKQKRQREAKSWTVSEIVLER